MNGWTYDAIRSATVGDWVITPSPDHQPPIGAAIDSRGVEPGMLFAAYKGERVDGHAFLKQAEQAGAVMMIVTDANAVASEVAVPVLLVDDTTNALERVASLWRGLLTDLRVVGVTGSNGKSTTCRLLHAAACSKGGLPGSRTQKSYNNAIGVPLTLLNTSPDDRVLVCEVGMSTPGEIAARCATARPDAVIITTVGEAHLEGVGSLEGIAREKASVAAGLPDGGRVFMPAGLALLEDAVAGLEQSPRVVRVRRDDQAIEADYELAVDCGGDNATRFRLDDALFEIPLLGAHNAMNAALAVLAARWLGVGDDTIRGGLVSASGPGMRLERVLIPAEPPIVVINDAYNANPSSMRAALAVLASEKGTRRVAVLGDMLELGAEEVPFHADVLGVARDMVDLVLTVGPRFARAAGSVDHQDHAIDRVIDQLEPGDVVLLKGSRGMRVERVLEALRMRFVTASDRSAVDS